MAKKNAQQIFCSKNKGGERRDFQNYLLGYGIEAKKSLGQNFLYESALLKKMLVDMVPPNLEVQRVVELGAGTGNLTAVLLQQDYAVTAVELDAQLQRPLQDRFQNQEQIRLVFKDALSFPLSDCVETGESYAVVGNLPYYITSKLIAHALLTASEAKIYSFLIQKEALDRLLRQKGRDYGPLQILMRSYAHMERGLFLSAANFCPVPEVDSQILLIHPFESELNRSIESRMHYYKFLKLAFSNRRKQFQNMWKQLQSLYPSLQKLKIQTWYERAGILDLKIRPEAIEVEQWQKLYLQLQEKPRVVEGSSR